MTEYPYNLKAKSADIAFILESAYPYILGGVSTWVEQLLKGFPNYTFAIIFLGGSPKNYQEGIRYKIPANVTHLQVHYLFDEDEPPSSTKLKVPTQNTERMRKIHKAFRCPHQAAMNEIGNLDLYQSKTGFDFDQFLHSEASFELLKEMYTEYCNDTSFIDYFWTVRNIHTPLWKLAKIVEAFPAVKLVHSASTGYAGLLSFLVNRHYKLPVVLSEHGIYTRERRIDVFLSRNFRDDYVIDRPLSDLSYLRNVWDRYFKTLAQLCYNIALPIVSLSTAANQVQVEEGAPLLNTRIIPNGIDLARFKPLQRTFDEKAPIVCFVGRIVPMKDVKGFIRAIPNIHAHVTDSTFWIIGSIDQDPLYAKECHELVENIALQQVVEFKLHQDMNDVLPNVKVMVLSALREGMPFIILESFAAGVPVVATDVGACKDMILGLSDEDKALGPAGIVVKVADTQAIEQAITSLLTDKEQWEKMSKAAILRAEKFYDQAVMIEQYANIYKERMSA